MHPELVEGRRPEPVEGRMGGTSTDSARIESLNAQPAVMRPEPVEGRRPELVEGRMGGTSTGSARIET